jgi:Tol biopolymer transport system component
MGTRVENETYSEFLIFSNWVPSRDADFSPDGVWITFESWPDGVRHDIYIMTPNGVNLQHVTDDPANDFDPTWRPPVTTGE